MQKKEIESIINTKKIDEADVVLLSAPYGQSFTFGSGAEKGPSHIIDCLHGNLEFFDRYLGFEPNRLVKTAHHNLTNLNKYSPDRMVETISAFYKKNNEKFILMLGGDHSVSIGAFHFFSTFKKAKDITILQIDAHPDLRDNTLDYKTTTHKYSHASVMRRGHEWGFKTVQVGLRAISTFDNEYIKKHNLKIFEWGRGKTPSIKSIVDSITTKDVYLTLDVDGIDPAHMPATGTPVPGGLEWHYTRELIREVIKRKNLVGADIVEVSPIKNNPLTEYAAAQLAYDIFSYRTLKTKKNLKFISK